MSLLSIRFLLTFWIFTCHTPPPHILNLQQPRPPIIMVRSAHTLPGNPRPEILLLVPSDATVSYAVGAALLVKGS